MFKDNRLADEKYFQQVVDEMRVIGVEHLHTHQIDSKQVPYHVGFYEFARVTTLFFRIPHRAIIISARFTEDIDKEMGYGHYWHLNVDAEFTPQSGVEEQAWWLWLNNFYEELCCSRFCQSHGSLNRQPLQLSRSFEEASIHFDEERMVPAELVSSIRELVEMLRSRVVQYFTELQVTDFSPHYQFPGCEEVFWAQFPEKTLRQAVIGRIWGK